MYSNSVFFAFFLSTTAITAIFTVGAYFIIAALSETYLKCLEMQISLATQDESKEYESNAIGFIQE